MDRVGLPLPFQRHLTKIYTDAKTSYDFVKDSVQPAEDPDFALLHRKLRVQKDRLVAWGLAWSDPSKSPDIDESLSRAGLGEVVASVMGTIKDTLGEAEPLWQASKRLPDRKGEKSDRPVDLKLSPITWDRNRFEDLVRDLTSSIDILHDLSRSRNDSRPSPSVSFGNTQTKQSYTDYSASKEPYRIQTPQKVDPSFLIIPGEPETRHVYPQLSGMLSACEHGHRRIVYMPRAGSGGPRGGDAAIAMVPMLLEFASFDPIYASTGITPDMKRFESLFAGIQTAQGHESGPDFGVLHLVGYFEDTINTRFGLLYELPTDIRTWDMGGEQKAIPTIASLERLLGNKEHEPALDVKFRLAYNIINTVLDLHKKKIVHSNLSGTSVAFFGEGFMSEKTCYTKINLRKPFITSFDLFPEAAQYEAPEPHITTHQRLHLHPHDPRIDPFTALNFESPAVDLYSLGIILVEIGIWQPVGATLTESFISGVDYGRFHKQIIRSCGRSYMNVVEACLEIGKSSDSHDDTARFTQRLYDTISYNIERCCTIDCGDESLLEEDLIIVSTKPIIEKSTTIMDNEKTSMSISDIEAHGHFADTKTTAVISQAAKQLEDDIRSMQLSREKDTHTTAEREKPKLRLFHDGEHDLAAHHYQHFSTVLGPALERALKNFFRKYPESVSMGLESIGESADKIRPTILITCTSVGKVKGILKRKFSYDSSTYNLLVWKGNVTRSRKNMAERSMDLDVQEDAINVKYQKQPHNGASISAYAESKHLGPVSFGGLVMVGEKTFGLTVHHMLDDGQDLPEKSETYDIATRTQEFDYDSEDGDYATSEYDSSFSDTSSITSNTVDYDDETFRPKDFGDLPGIDVECGEGYMVTQPAFNDVGPDFYPDENFADEEHLDSHTLGEIYASSGIRRKEQDGISHEIDWALFRFEPDRQPTSNHIEGGSQHCAEPQYPINHALSSDLSGLDVHCNARTSGLQTGRILPGMRLVKMHGRQSSSMSYEVSGRLGIAGDSGAWVIGNKDGLACGHILAYSSRKQVAYICPMEIMLEDISETLEMEVKLPGVSKKLLDIRGINNPQDTEDVHERSDRRAIDTPSSNQGEDAVTAAVSGVKDIGIGGGGVGIKRSMRGFVHTGQLAGS